MPVRRSASALGPPPAVHPPAVHPPGRPSPGGAREAVEVRTEAVDGVPTPVQLLRGGRLWLVRSAEPVADPGRRWRVTAAPGPAEEPEAFELVLADGRWSLVRTRRGAAGEPAWA